MSEMSVPERESLLDRRIGGVSWEHALYTLFIVLAIASRFVMLGARVQSHDESLHTRYSWELYDGQGFSHNPMMHGPFLFHAASLSYWLFGDNDATARVPVAVLGVFLVAFPYLLRRQLGRAGALVTSFLFLISPSLLYYSRYIRMDVPVIVFSLILVWSIWSYLRDREEKYLYWFAGALSLMFATKEVAFLYVAIFGSFVALRLTVHLLSTDWHRSNMLGWFQIGLIGLLVGALVFGAGMVVQSAAEPSLPDAGGEADEAMEAGEDAEPGEPVQPWRILQLVGGALAGIALVVTVAAAFLGLNDGLRDYAEFDLVVLFSTLLLPFMVAVPITALGYDPMDYSSQGMIRTALFLAPMIAVAILVGVWWDWRRWLGAAGVFYFIFAVLFTTVFTNGRGFATGWVGSLGYWIAQQAVERGSQPWYFYFFVVPIYEYLPLLGAVAAALLWLTKGRGGALLSRLLSSVFRLEEGDRGELFSFVPFVLWWALMTWIVYSYAGEKMGWLTVHFAVPMIVLAGWAFGRLLQADSAAGWAATWKRGGWALVILVPILIAALGRGVAPLLTGQVKWGDQQLDNLILTGRMLSGIAVAVGAGIAVYYFARRVSAGEAGRVFAVAVIGFLSVMTIRTAWMASYINYNTAKEYIVYAHGAPGTKQVMKQIEDISLRMHGDLSIRVSFDNDVSWPFWWYLRDYPNKVYFGDSPSRDSFDVPVAVVGDKNWAKVEPYVGNRFYSFEYSYIWWPMEDYKGLSWERLKGALTNPDMRAALWDILMNRDYARYSQVTGRDFSLASWPLRNRMRLYIRKDVAAQLWDYGVGPAATELAYEEPYAEDYYPDLEPVVVIGKPGAAQDELQAPRGIALGPGGLLYVADSAAHQIKVYGTDGQYLRSWGGLCDLGGATAGCTAQFKEPWGVAVAPDGTVYVADTWNHRIQRFTADGEFLGAWGRFGQTGAGQTAGELGVFYGPRDLAISSEGLIYVTDTGNKLIQVFESDGRYVGEFGGPGPFDGQLDEPVGLDFGPDGALYVVDTWNGRVQVFDRNHTFLRQWPVEAWYGQSVNNKPYLAVDDGGRVYVTDPELFRVIVFDPQGNYLYSFGQYSTESDGMALPTGIAVGEDGVVYVSDAGNGRILGYRPPGE
jgi:uncharacterized protein (TIGR03663 family)